MAQSPTIAIPKKSTDEVDWTGPIRAIIKSSYGENPDNYAAECAALQRCRQDAVRGAGSDLTAASLLTKYFGQLELLELRFSEIRVSFPWRDAFTSKLTTQTSMAFEKASIIYQIAATHSSIANSQNRSDPEGLKRAYYYFRTCAGMLTYINDNFLHAPSTDLSREVIKFLVGITMAQANETFYETCIDQRKSPTLVSKVAAHTAFLYTSLCEEVKEFFGKGIFDRNWVTLLQIKSKYFTSLMHYHRALADSAAGKHGEALARFIVAENNAKEAHKLASSFAPYFVTTLSTTLPADTGTAILEITKAHLALCTEKHTQGQKDNDLIYNAIVPAEATLPAIDKISAVTPVPIQEVYGTPEVQKTIGPDLFAKLIPLSVHEGASVYSEEKAKIVRAEVEKADVAESEIKAGLESLGVKAGLPRYKEIAEGEVDDSVPPTVLSWHDEVKRRESTDAVEKHLQELDTLKDNVTRDLNAIDEMLGTESRECEMMRVKFGHKWTQEPSSGPAKDIRKDLKDHKATLEAAAPSDQQVYSLWSSIRSDIALLVSRSQLEGMFASAVSGSAADLLDVGEADTDDAEREKMRKLVREIEERLGKINKIARERNEVLKDLKEKVQNDDVSHLLLLNRRTSGIEPTLFANELEKFRPYQSRLASTTHAQQATLQEIAQLWKNLKDKGGKGKGAKKWEEREKRVHALVKRFGIAREGYLEVSDGVMKGLQFYKDLTNLTKKLHDRANTFVSARNRERESLAGRLEIETRLEGAPSTPSAGPLSPSLGSAPRVPPPPPRPLESSFASMNLGGSSAPPPMAPSTVASPPPAPNAWQQHQRTASNAYPPPPQQHTNSYPPPPASSGYSYSPYTQSPPPPPPPVQQQQQSYGSGGFPPPPNQQPAIGSAPPPPDPYAGMFSSGGFSNQFSTAPAPPVLSSNVSSPLPPPPQQQSWGAPYSGYQSTASGYGTQSPPPPPPAQSYGGYTGYQSPPPAQSQPAYGGYPHQGPGAQGPPGSGAPGSGYQSGGYGQPSYQASAPPSSQQPGQQAASSSSSSFGYGMLPPPPAPHGGTYQYR